MKKRMIIPLVLVLLLAAGAGGYYFYTATTYKQTLENATSLLSEQQENIESVQGELESFTEDSYLRKGLTAEDIQAVQDKLDTMKDLSSEFNLKENDLKEEIAEITSDKEALHEKLMVIRTQLETQQSVNDLFEQDTPAIDGSEVNETLVIKEDLNRTRLEDVRETAFVEDGDISEWQIAINTSVTEAEDQVDQIQVATDHVNELFEGNEVKPNVLRSELKDAEDAISKIVNEAIQEEFNEKLTMVNTFIVQQEEEAQVKEDATALVQQQEPNSAAENESEDGPAQSENGSSDGDSSPGNSSGSSYNSSSENASKESSSGSSSTPEEKSEQTGGEANQWFDQFESGQTWETEVESYSLIDSENRFPKVSGRTFDTEEELHAAMEQEYPDYDGTYSWQITGKVIDF